MLTKFRGAAFGLALALAGIAAATAATLTGPVTGVNGTDQRNRTVAGFSTGSFADSLTATAGGGQTNALQLFNQTNRVTTVASSGDSVKLPSTQSLPGMANSSLAGTTVVVVNSGVNPMQVYGFGTDTINAIAAATGISQMPNSAIAYQATNIGTWVAPGICTGYAGNLPTSCVTDGITAHAGGGRASAVPLTTALNRVTTVGTAADSVILPSATPGLAITVINAAGANAMQVFAVGTDTIDGTAGATGFSQTAGKTATYYCTAAGAWHKLLSA